MALAIAVFISANAYAQEAAEATADAEQDSEEIGRASCRERVYGLV